MDQFSFQYCQKLVIVDDSFEQVFLAKRKGEQDYDGTYSFVGGKAENTDLDLLDSLKREKEEEIGKSCSVRIYTDYSVLEFYRKKDQTAMVLAHYLGVFQGGDIVLGGEEYSGYKRVLIENLDLAQPQIETIPSVITRLLEIKEVLLAGSFLDV